MPNAPIIRDSATGKFRELPSAQKLGVTLGQVQNVNLNALQDGDVVRWNGTTQTFENATNTAQISPLQQFWF